MWWEEDVLDHTGVSLFLSSLARGLILWDKVIQVQWTWTLWASELSPLRVHLQWSFQQPPTQILAESPGDADKARQGGVQRDKTHLNGKLQHHVDDSFPTAGKVESFRQPDSGTHRGRKGQDEMGRHSEDGSCPFPPVYLPPTAIMVNLPSYYQIQGGPG